MGLMDRTSVETAKRGRIVHGKTKRAIFRLAAPLLALVLLTSCSRWISDYYWANWVEFRQGDYSYAIVRYKRFLEKYRKPTRKREVALINLGRSYMAMKDYFDAQMTFETYIKEFPEGDFVNVARQNLDQIRRVADTRRQQLAKQFEQAKARASRLEAELAKKPNDPDLLVALGNAYWEMGRYNSAGKAYLKAIEIKPELKSNPLMLERLIFDINGNLIPIKSPEDRIKLEREREPLVIENLHDYKSRGFNDFYSGRRRIYIVTGTVRNRSTRPILGVEVEITFFDAIGQILDVETARIGTLYPQQSRPFVVRAGVDAETMNNITRYRCRTFYKQ